jgi:protoporphyrinogen oxidase
VDQRILIIGAGPCGLACGRELRRIGHRNWLIVEQADHAGGLASSVVDREGFTWDLGGHVVFSHFREFDALLDEVMGDEICDHERSSYVRYDDRWVPYPFQNNLHHLPEAVRDECLEGLRRAPGGAPAMDFATWMRAVFGDGITRHFMAPYNAKVWATPSELMASDWIAERVSVVDYERIRATIASGQDDLAWGPNNRFVFPAVGGTGEIYRRVALDLGDRVQLRRMAVAIDPDARLVRFADGGRESYDALVSTMPLDLLVAAIDECPRALRDAATKLRHTSVYMVGVGYRTALTDDKSWMYFPDARSPFYRATNFAKYAAANVPEAGTASFCSYMTETSYSQHRPEPRAGIEERVEQGLRATGVVAGAPPVASIHVEDIPYAYPVPTRDRDDALAALQPWLEEREIYSRGRFGTWRYEIGNMDHATKMGVDVARALVQHQPEELCAV